MLPERKSDAETIGVILPNGKAKKYHSVYFVDGSQLTIPVGFGFDVSTSDLTGIHIYHNGKMTKVPWYRIRFVQSDR